MGTTKDDELKKRALSHFNYLIKNIKSLKDKDYSDVLDFRSDILDIVDIPHKSVLLTYGGPNGWLDFEIRNGRTIATLYYVWSSTYYEHEFDLEESEALANKLEIFNPGD